MSHLRARDLGLPFLGRTGPHNAITDVPGVLVGFTTLIEGDGPLVQGQGPIRTGVTAILPRGFDPEPLPVWAAIHALNGNGEMTGSHWVKDGGYFLGPVCITNTHSVGIVHHAATRWTIRHFAGKWGTEHLWAMPVVAETYDGTLNDINGQHVTEAHALAAIDGAQGGSVPEGNVGGGTGMIAYGFKGGTGTASRMIELGGRSGTVGVLVQANHGRRPDFTVLGVPVGAALEGADVHARETGSIIVVIGTDLPLLPHQLDRLARRATIGIGRGGTPGGNSSGDIFLAFTTANGFPVVRGSAPLWSFQALNDEIVDPLYMAAIQATEEAVLNAMVAAHSMTAVRPEGLMVQALDHQALCHVMKSHGRLS
ncbi:DmpA family aminopeptidase [Zavarzinia sp. CC-PAN008]|uniref:DmpA family aminopeptidase n=1 Tax=Zavarzinia sp. CC-PAN008 TaxID=3243332 RepID=UPI003F7494E0